MNNKSEQQHPLLYLQDELIFKMAAFFENRPPCILKPAIGQTLRLRRIAGLVYK
jgi:hypothetical protein